MTASKTPRLGLMYPVGSDAFTTADFVQTMGILDANPGIPVVLNAASRPSTYTAAQHGSMVYQQDLNIIWSWFQPSSSQAGYWRRTGNYGLLGSSAASGSFSTTNTNYANGITVAQLTVTVPGGRPIQVGIDWDTLGNSYYRPVVSYWENNVRIIDRAFYGDLPSYVSGGGWVFPRDPAPNGSLSLTAKVTVASFAAAAPNGSGTTRANGFRLSIWET